MYSNTEIVPFPPLFITRLLQSNFGHLPDVSTAFIICVMEAWEHRSPFNMLKHSCTRELLRAQWWKQHLILTDWTWRKAGGCPNCTESAAPEGLYRPTMLLHLEVSSAKVNSRSAKGWGTAANSRFLYPKSWINVKGGNSPMSHRSVSVS